MPPEDASDAVRRAAGFLTVGEVVALAPEVSVLDPGSTLVGADVTIGSGTTTTRIRRGGQRLSLSHRERLPRRA